MLHISHTTLSAQNNPYVDDKIVHFGFFLGVDMPSFIVDSIPNPEWYARCSTIGYGCNVGFITDLRLTRHLNLRFTPGLHFDFRTLNYKKKANLSEENSATVMSIPITLPLYIKWSAEREGNYRPYVIAGGGFSLDFNAFGVIKEDMKLKTKPYDGFISIGFGCDLYFPWFKLCPEIRYQLGFANMLVNLNEKVGDSVWEPRDEIKFYTENISRLTNQSISLIFNFE